MNFEDLILLPEARRLVIGEHKPAIEVESRTWTATGGGSHWAPMTDGEIIEVTQGGAAYDEVFTVAECDAAASTFFMDIVNQRLYLHTSPAGVIPSHQTGGVYDFCLLAYFIIGFADRVDADGRDPVFEPEIEMLLDGGFEDWTSATLLAKWTDTHAGASAIAREASA